MPSLNGSLGALIVGYTISIFLFGISTSQFFVYIKNFPNDRSSLKILVTGVWLLELGHSICMSISIYDLTVTLFGNPNFLIKTPKALDAGILFSGTLALVVQLFFNYRAWRVTKQALISFLLSILSLLRFIASIALAAEAFLMTHLKLFAAEFRWLITVAWVIGALTDVFTTLLLCYTLHRKQRQSTIESTIQVLDKLIVWTIQTGFITSVTAVTIAICFLTMKSNLVWLGMYMFLPRLFANTLFTALNIRRNFRDMKNNVISLSQLPTNRIIGSRTLCSLENSTEIGAELKIEVSTIQMVDVEPEPQSIDHKLETEP